MFSFLKRFLPADVLLAYHALISRVAQIRSGNPSASLVVIGVTGTNGKSSTVQFIAQLLTALGEKVGYTSTAGFSIAGKEVPNRMKMTMPGRFTLQNMLADMKRAGCTYAVIETSSQGLAQYRHTGILYDVVVFTNLTPEHIEAHGGFDRYREAKGLLFSHLMTHPRKFLRGKEILRQSIINVDDAHAPYFLAFPADVHWKFGWNAQGSSDAHTLLAQEQGADAQGATLALDKYTARLPLPARFARLNALAAIATVHACGFSLAQVMRAAEGLRNIAGRFERIDCGQPFTVIVDYAYEPYALQALFDAVPAHTGKIIGIHGSAGGGRDVARRPKIGALAAACEDVVIVTNEDPYDEDPLVIIEQVAQGAREAGKCEGGGLHVIPDRKEAITFALSSAQPGDVVLVTGKGSEPVMAVANGALLPWDDRAVVRSVLLSLGYGA